MKQIGFSTKRAGKTLLAYRLLTLALILAMLLFNPSTPVQADTTVCGPIVVDTTWTIAGNSYLVTCDVKVMSGVTLTIESGVVVKFGDDVSLQVDGTLIAQDATFTSIKTTPAKGDWGQILLTTSSTDATFDTQGDYLSGSIIQNSLIEWAGGGSGVAGALGVSGASPFINHNTIQNNGAGGIHATGRSATIPIVIIGNSVGNNSKAGNGAGIFVSSGHLISNTVSNNVTNFVTGDNGGGIYAANSTLTGNTVSANNSYRAGGGIYESGSILTNNTVSGNISGNYGGGVYAMGGTLTDNTVSGNTSRSGRGGGVYAQGATLINNSITGNTSQAGSAYGGGVYAELGTMTGNTVSNNVAMATSANSFGGGIYASGTSVTDNTINSNTVGAPNATATGFGGGIYAEGGSISNNVISGNTASGGNSSRGGGVYGNLNALQGNTFTGNSAHEGGALYTYKGTVTNNTILTNTATLSGTVYVNEGTAAGNTLRGNSAPYGGGIYAFKATLVGNTIQNNTASIKGGGIYAIQSTAQGNTILNNIAQTDGGGIYANQGALTSNIISLNTVPSYGRGSGMFLTGDIAVTYNSVLSNTASDGTVGGIAIDNLSLLQYNNFYGNSPFDAEVVGASDVAATLNYWGLSACTAIPGQIYDGNDAPGRGKLTYAPSLYSPVPVAQLNAPTNLTMDIGTSSVTLSWTPISAIPANVGCRVPGSSAPDLVYRVYYDTDSCAPYDGQGLPQGSSPIEVGPNTSITFNTLSAQGYVYAVTAKDYLGRESAYSNEIGTPSEGYKIYLPLVLKNA